MKRFLALALVLMLACLCVTALNAEETQITPPATENATPETNAPTEPENEAQTATDFFNATVMPLLLGVGSGLTITVGAFLVVLKMWGRLKDAAYTVKDILTKKKATEEENAYLKEQLSKVDINTFKQEFDASVEQAQNKLKLDEQMLTEVAANATAALSMMKSFVEAAKIAWGNSPAALAILSTAESGTLKSMTAKINSYENYIRTEKGAEAEDIIHKIEGV